MSGSMPTSCALWFQTRCQPQAYLGGEVVDLNFILEAALRLRLVFHLLNHGSCTLKSKFHVNGRCPGLSFRHRRGGFDGLATKNSGGGPLQGRGSGPVLCFALQA